MDPSVGRLAHDPFSRALVGRGVQQREVRLRVLGAGGEKEVVVLVSAAPFQFQGETLAALILQDVSVLHRLRGIVPICAVARRSAGRTRRGTC